MQQKLDGSFFIFSIIFFELPARIFSLLKQEHLSSTVNVLTNSPKISVVTKRHVFHLNLTQKNETIDEILVG